MSSKQCFGTVSEELPASFDSAFLYLADPANLPEWALAFKQADSTSAVMSLPDGDVPIGLITEVSKQAGTIDWHMKMPDGSVMRALSRLNFCTEKSTVYTFTFFAENVADELLDAQLAEMRAVIVAEFENLRKIFTS